ncbi:B3 domain-containing protein At3g17010-like [Trifolium pratense]|uniref:B3 domain-containing protein At3g17010-like n=1 Tax=Trifolium pratense TaxID=57577 RepID=UPI001E695F48|nr:B3 domain-containing protein At3g17010-like [Trifolium pratense]
MSFHYFPEFHRIIYQDKKLSIPKKYVEKYWKGMSNPIFLRFPNGVEQQIFWGESNTNDDICFQKNWENFAKCLKYGNLLTFKHIGGPYFMVNIFGVNGLEINYSNVKSIVDQQVAKEIAKQPQRKSNIKREISADEQVVEEGMMKKAKKCTTTGNVGDNNQNPFFEVVLSKTYAAGFYLSIPSEFSTQQLKKLEDINATLRVGEDTPMQVSFKFYKFNKSIISGGWTLFCREYNLKVNDVCKFVMIQSRPLSFNVIIDRAKDRPRAKKLSRLNQRSK